MLNNVSNPSAGVCEENGSAKSSTGKILMRKRDKKRQGKHGFHNESNSSNGVISGEHSMGNTQLRSNGSSIRKKEDGMAL